MSRSRSRSAAVGAAAALSLALVVGGAGSAEAQPKLTLEAGPSQPEPEDDGRDDAEPAPAIRIREASPRLILRPLPVILLEPDLDGDGIPDVRDDDDDGDGLRDAEEQARGTDPRRADTDGDGYTDYQEVYDPRLTHPPADYRTAGASGCNPLKRDIFVELDYLGPKTWWFIDYCGHAPNGEPLEDMIERFEEHGYNVFICVDDEIPHVSGGQDRERLERSDVFALRDRYRDYPVYYYCLYADEAGAQLEHDSGKFGVAFYQDNNFVVFEGHWYLIGDLVGMTTMHELGHLLIDRYPSNPQAAHLVSQPSEWNDGAHCPNACVLNYASKLSFWEAISQWWEFDFCDDCWGAIRGFYDKP